MRSLGFEIPQSASCLLGRIKLTYRLSGECSSNCTQPRSHGQRVGVAIVGLGGFYRDLLSISACLFSAGLSLV